MNEIHAHDLMFSKLYGESRIPGTLPDTHMRRATGDSLGLAI
jgi:hypothetical protein